MRIGVLASGGGSNLQALIDHFRLVSSGRGAVAFVASNREDAGALVRARDAGIRAATVASPGDGDALLGLLRDAGVELVVLAGYLKHVPLAVVRAYHGRMLNVHPALLPSFGGAGMFGTRVHAAVIAHGAALTGVTVHFVNEEFDRGAIVAQWPVAVREDDSAETLAARVLRTEHRLLPLCVEGVAAGEITLGDDGRVHGVPDRLRPDFLDLLR